MLTYGLEETDEGRKREYEKARMKGKDVTEWSDEAHSLGAVLGRPPGG